MLQGPSLPLLPSPALPVICKEHHLILELVLVAWSLGEQDEVELGCKQEPCPRCCRHLKTSQHCSFSLCSSPWQESSCILVTCWRPHAAALCDGLGLGLGSRGGCGHAVCSRAPLPVLPHAAPCVSTGSEAAGEGDCGQESYQARDWG